MQADDLRRAREVLGGKLKAALQDEVGLLERISILETDKSALEEKVSALQEGQGAAVQSLAAQLAAGESERAALQKAGTEQRLAHEEVILLEPSVGVFTRGEHFEFHNKI